MTKQALKCTARNIQSSLQLKPSDGVKTDSTLSTLLYFHVSSNSFDIMHDILEGVAQWAEIVIWLSDRNLNKKKIYF